MIPVHIPTLLEDQSIATHKFTFNLQKKKMPLKKLAASHIAQAGIKVVM